MRHQSRSLSRGRSKVSLTPTKSPKVAKSTSQSDFYYCHYSNAMYMGGIKAFQKHGRGIMVHDDGTSVISSYFNDFRHGQNILYKEHCILSLQYHKNKIAQCVIRISSYLLLIRFNKDGEADGKSILVDYESKNIYYVRFKRGVVIQKIQEQNASTLNRIFVLQNMEYLIGQSHTRAIKFDIQTDQNIASQLVANKFQVGFYKKGLMNGLGFILNVKGSSSSNEQNTSARKQFYIKSSERGYFYNSLLSGTGQKWFKNGNYYYGDFKNGLFQGSGILKNQLKNNWVYGQFHNNNLSQLIEYSHEGDLKKLKKIILSMHERKNNWINNYIQIPSQECFLKQIDKIIISNPTQQMRNLKQRKEQVLRRIQSNFINDDQPQSSNSARNTANYNQINQIKANYLSSQSKNKNSSSSRKEAHQFASAHSNDEFRKQNYQNNNFGSPKSYKNYKQTNQNRQRQNIEKNQKSRSVTTTPNSRLKSPISKQSNSKVTQKNHQSSVQKNTKQTFALDQRRMIGKSRILKNYSDQSEDLPKFNYNNIK